MQSRLQSTLATFEILPLIVDRCSSEMGASCLVPLGTITIVIVITIPDCLLHLFPCLHPLKITKVKPKPC